MLIFPKPNENAEELFVDYFELDFAQCAYPANCVNGSLSVPFAHNLGDS